jgi:hypothetical protein
MSPAARIRVNVFESFRVLTVCILFKIDHIIVRLSKEHKKLNCVEVFRLYFIVPQIKAFTILYF